LSAALWRYAGPEAECDIGDEALHALLDPNNAYFAMPRARSSASATSVLMHRCPAVLTTMARWEWGGSPSESQRRGAGRAFTRAVLDLGYERFAPPRRSWWQSLPGTPDRFAQKQLDFRRVRAFRRTRDDRECIQMIEIVHGWVNASCEAPVRKTRPRHVRGLSLPYWPSGPGTICWLGAAAHLIQAVLRVTRCRLAGDAVARHQFAS